MTEIDQLTSIIILSYNRLNDLKNNLNSLYQQTNLPFEVIIFDNGSEQETRDYLRQIEGKTKKDKNGKIKVFYSNNNLGCSSGRKKAIQKAKGDYIYTVDNDITYTLGWLDALVERIEQDPLIGASCSQIVYPNGEVQLNGGLLYLEEDYFGFFEEIDQGKNEFDALTGELDCDWMPGGATLFKREVVEQVKHSEGYLNGFEDYDYSFQIRKLGYRLVNCPQSKVYHHHIKLDPEKQEKETGYLNARWNPQRTWISLVHFLERTGINMIKGTDFEKWIERDGSKPFLRWSYREGIEYQDLFFGRPFSKMENNEIREQFDSIIATNNSLRKQPQQHQAVKGYTCIPFITQQLSEMNEAFSNFNLNNLARHLDWIISTDLRNQQEITTEDILYLVEEFKNNTTEINPQKAEIVYTKIKKELSRALRNS